MRKREIHVRFNSVDFCYKNLNNLKCYIQYRGKIYRTFRNQERLQYMYTSRCLINTFVKQKVETLKENNNSKKHFSELKCFYRNIKTQPCLGKRGWSKLSLISRSAHNSDRAWVICITQLYYLKFPNSYKSLFFVTQSLVHSNACV